MKMDAVAPPPKTPLWKKASAGLLIALAFIGVVFLGIIATQTQANYFLAQQQARKYCADSTRIMREYCTSPQYFALCFAMVEQVEAALRLESKRAIFDAIKVLEGASNNQTGPFVVWAVDENAENEDSHLDLTTAGTADYFNNSAYFYSQEAHVNSVMCGGWSLGFWKTRPPVKRSIQIAYCEDNRANVRVCGAFDVFAEN